MRHFTQTDRLLSKSLPLWAGVTMGGFLSVLVGEAPYWWVLYVVGLVPLLLSWRVRVHGRRRFEEIYRLAQQRGWDARDPNFSYLKRHEVAELGRIHGRAFEAEVYALAKESQGME